MTTYDQWKARDDSLEPNFDEDEWDRRHMPLVIHPPSSEDTRLEWCDCTEYRPNGPDPDCRCCRGTGLEEVPQEPITQDDLDDELTPPIAAYSMEEY